MALFCGIHEKYAMWKFIVDVVNDFVSSLQPDVGRGFLHVSNVFLLSLLRPEGHVFHTAWETMIKSCYSTLAD